MHEVVVLALPGTIAFDLSTPVEVLGRAGYRVRVAAAAEGLVDLGAFRLATDVGLEALAEAGTIVLPGREHPEQPVPVAVLDALRAAAATGTRLVSICVGAFTLAATGLLDGRRATTHWAAAEEFRTLHPAVDLDPNVLWVDEGSVMTSAGASAGIDLCLHLVERDLGAAAAADAARLAVSPLRRDGGQAQYIPHRPEPATSHTIDELLIWLDANHHRDLSVAAIAARAAVSERTLTRRFREATGQSPVQWLTRRRLQQARELLETSDLDVEHVARHVGFSSPSNFRSAFLRQHGIAPQGYRRTFRSGGARGRRP